MTRESTRRGPGRPRDEGLAERRREQILAAATAAFAQMGYRCTDVDAIAQAVSVGKGTVYRYFPTKKELFLAAADRGMRLLAAWINAEAEAVSDDPLEMIARAIRAYLAFFDAHPELVELIIQERAEFKDRGQPTYFAHKKASEGPWRRLIRDLIRAGRLREMPAQRIVEGISDMLYGVIFTNHFAGRRQSLETQAQHVTDLIFGGILSDAERRRRLRKQGGKRRRT